MALAKFLCGVTLMLLLNLEGSHAYNSRCGIMNIPGTLPWQAVISTNGYPCCFGTLITSEYVLTDGHCDLGPYDVAMVSLGNLYKSDPVHNCEETRYVIDVKCNMPSPKSRLIKDGICLLKLDYPVKFTDYIFPICLPDTGCPFPTGTPSYIETGPGYKVGVDIVGYKECSCSIPTLGVGKICAGHGKGKSDPDLCLKNLGGGLITQIGGYWTLLAVMGVDQSCRNPEALRGYTDVVPSTDFILNCTTHNPPGVVTYHPTGPDPDAKFVCPAPGMPWDHEMPCAPGMPCPFPRDLDSVFDSGVTDYSNPFVLLCVLVLSLFVTN